MQARLISFGLIEIDGLRFEHDVVLEHGRVSKRRKGASKPLRGRYGHTPLSLLEPIPWDCRRLIVGTGADGELPIAPDVRDEARRRGVELVVAAHRGGVRAAGRRGPGSVNAILHVTC